VTRQKGWTRQESANLGEEIDWLRSFRWPDERVAKRLGVTVDALEQRDRKRGQGTGGAA
jgi:hypothetical protein